MVLLEYARFQQSENQEWRRKNARKKKLLKNNQTVPQQHKQNNTILKVKELTQDTQIHSSLLPSYIFLTTQA